jgi:hypothetical protein
MITIARLGVSRWQWLAGDWLSETGKKLLVKKTLMSVCCVRWTCASWHLP